MMNGKIIATLALLLSPAVHAQIAVPIEALEVNLVGFAAASVPEYWGASRNSGALGPYGRYQFEGSQRYIELLGPQVKVNLLNDKNWRIGPIVKYRFARDSDVDDKIVRRMDKVDGALEGGMFIQYRLPLSETPLHQITVGADVEGGRNGTEAHLNAMYFQPLGKAVLANVGLGLTYGNGKFVDNYFGVTSAHDIALYPALAGRAYDTSGGVVGWNIPFGVTVFVSKEWALSAGGRYERLVGDAKDSPLVRRGDADQWMLGIGAAYLFK